jgi:hypothetical protein
MCGKIAVAMVHHFAVSFQLGLAADVFPKFAVVPSVLQAATVSERLALRETLGLVPFGAGSIDAFLVVGSLKAPERTCPQHEFVHRLRFKLPNFNFRQESVWRISVLGREMRPNGRLSGTKVASRYD